MHRAQERSEARVSEIHEGLKESEEELRVLERELADIAQLDRDLHELTHERAMLEAKAQDSEEQAAVALQELEAGEIGGAAPGTGQSGGLSKLDPAARRAAAKKAKKEARERAAEAYALEMAEDLATASQVDWATASPPRRADKNRAVFMAGLHWVRVVGHHTHLG